MEFQDLYQRMFAAKQVRDDALAERLMIEMEELRRREHSFATQLIRRWNF